MDPDLPFVMMFNCQKRHEDIKINAYPYFVYFSRERQLWARSPQYFSDTDTVLAVPYSLLKCSWVQCKCAVYHTLNIWLEMELPIVILLKTSFCTDYSPNILITRKINSFITKSHRKFIWETLFYSSFFQPLEFFVRLKTWFLDLYQVKVIFYRN